MIAYREPRSKTSIYRKFCPFLSEIRELTNTGHPAISNTKTKSSIFFIFQSLHGFCYFLTPMKCDVLNVTIYKIYRSICQYVIRTCLYISYMGALIKYILPIYFRLMRIDIASPGSCLMIRSEGPLSVMGRSSIGSNMKMPDRLFRSEFRPATIVIFHSPMSKR